MTSVPTGRESPRADPSPIDISHARPTSVLVDAPGVLVDAPGVTATPAVAPRATAALADAPGVTAT